MPKLATARLILGIVCASYLLSAMLLGGMRASGQTVPLWKIGGWIGTGVVGALLLIWLSPARPLVSVAMIVALVPWMLYATVEDTIGRHYIIAVVDAAGLFAIVYAILMLF